MLTLLRLLEQATSYFEPWCGNIDAQTPLQLWVLCCCVCEFVCLYACVVDIMLERNIMRTNCASFSSVNNDTSMCRCINVPYTLANIQFIRCACICVHVQRIFNIGGHILCNISSFNVWFLFFFFFLFGSIVFIPTIPRLLLEIVFVSFVLISVIQSSSFHRCSFSICTTPVVFKTVLWIRYDFPCHSFNSPFQCYFYPPIHNNFQFEVKCFYEKTCFFRRVHNDFPTTCTTLRSICIYIYVLKIKNSNGKDTQKENRNRNKQSHPRTYTVQRKHRILLSEWIYFFFVLFSKIQMTRL